MDLRSASQSVSQLVCKLVTQVFQMLVYFCLPESWVMLVNKVVSQSVSQLVRKLVTQVFEMLV